NDPFGRRSLIKTGLAAGGAALLSACNASSLPMIAGATDTPDDKSDLTDRGDKKKITKGDAAILRFLAAAEILETDLWQQYNELAGVQDAEVPGGSGNPAYTEAIKALDEDMDVYIHDNTENE